MRKERNRVIWTPTARHDLLDIWDYFVSVASPEIADNLLREIHIVAGRLLMEPRMFAVRRDLMPNLPGGLRSMPVHPYAIFYRIEPLTDADDQDMHIIRVLHEQRDFSAVLQPEKRHQSTEKLHTSTAVL